ncbi:MAG: hypothetical protein AB1750_07555 [Chloroflexota bacterium]
MKPRSFQLRAGLPLLILFFASALTYLPFIPQIGFSNDDWYLVYGAHVRGPDYFAPAYERDRPMRALVLAPEYALFGDNPLPYHLAMYVFRLLSAATLFWLLNRLWPAGGPSLRAADGRVGEAVSRPRRRSNPPVVEEIASSLTPFVPRNDEAQLPTTNLLVTLLFLLYPGFLSQPNPVDYQSQIIALFAVIASLALTAAALQVEKLPAKIAYTIFSFLLAWLYLGLIEYYIGLEVLRFVIVYLLVNRKYTGKQVNTYTSTQVGSQPESSNQPYAPRATQHASPIFYLLSYLGPTLLSYLPFLLGPLTFLIWRLFFFSSERNATDVGLQLGALFSSPTTGLWWLARFVQDTINVIFLAWGVPLYNLAFNLRLSQTWIGLALAGAVAVGMVFVLRKAETRFLRENGFLPGETGFLGEMLWVGLVAAMAGLVPVILVNRHVEFFSLSRYTLASSVGAAMAVVAMLGYLSSARVRWSLVGLLIGASVLTHFANGAIAAKNTEAMNDFWWQVSWRVPDLKGGATLVIYYPAPLQEDYFIWGAANLIYRPAPQTTDPVEVAIAGVLLTPENLTRVLAGKGADEPDRRNAHLVMDYGNVLVITQPTPGACVRVLDGTQPELSVSDDPRIQLVAPSSKIENVDAQGGHAPVNEFVFGPEPAHGWCWYYQRASLARQLGDWEQAAALGDEALELGFYPSDSVEWFPFLQAYAALGREKDLKKLSSILGADAFLKNQACAVLTGMEQAGTLVLEVQSIAMEWYCGK